MIKYVTLFILILFSCDLISQTTEGDDSLKNLKEVIISYQANFYSPIAFQNIHKTELERASTGQEPSFLLAEKPSITNYSDGGNSQGYSYFRMRGIDQTRINITLDGVPLNEPEDQGAYFSNYPDLLNSVSIIQIQNGVGTTKNGVASYGGSIQLFSPNQVDSSYTALGFGYGSFNSLRGFAEYNSGLKKNKSLYVRASQIYSDGYKYNASNNSQSVFLSSGLVYRKSAYKFNLLLGQQKNGLAWLGVSDSLIARDRRSNANSEQEKDQFVQGLVQLQNSWAIKRGSFLQSSIYSTFLKGNYGFDLNNFLGFPPTTELFNYAFESNLVGFYSNYTFTNKKLRWITGVHGNTYNRKHIGSEKNLGQLYQNKGLKNEASLFTKAEYSIKKLWLFADIQYRYVNFNYQGTVPFAPLTWNFINPKAGASLTLGEGSVVYYSIGSTGREPTRNDMFGGNDDLLADSLGNALLFNTQAEHVLDHEFGLRVTRINFNLNVNLYYMDFKNEIVLDGKFGPNGLALTNNVEQSIRTGVEISARYKVNPAFSLVHNSSFNYSRITEQTEVFTPILTPALIINQGIVLQHRGVSLTVSARYQSGSFIDFANDEKLAGYFLLNSRVSYEIKHFQCSLFINNITNAKYFNQGYVDDDGTNKYFVQAPINAYASIQYTF